MPGRRMPTNIAEGSKCQSAADYARFLNIAEASLAETEYLPLLAFDLGYVSNEGHQPIAAEIDEVARMLNALRVKVEQSDPQLWTQGSRRSTRGSGASVSTTYQVAA